MVELDLYIAPMVMGISLLVEGHRKFKAFLALLDLIHFFF